MTKADFSREAGVTRAAISIALSKGRVIAERDGSVDPKRKVNAAYLTTAKRQRRQAGRKAGASPAHKPPPSAPERKKVTRRGRDEESVGGELQLNGETYSEAELRKMIAQANKEEQTVEVRRGELVERADVKSVFARVYMIIGAQVKTIPEKLGPNLAAAFNLAETDIPRVQEIMGLDTMRALTQIKKEFNAYLDSIGEAMLESE